MKTLIFLLIAGGVSFSPVHAQVSPPSRHAASEPVDPKLDITKSKVVSILNQEVAPDHRFKTDDKTCGGRITELKVRDVVQKNNMKAFSVDFYISTAVSYCAKLVKSECWADFVKFKNGEWELQDHNCEMAEEKSDSK